MEELTKTQIVLLTLLVTFVTSIATGIVTVTLLDQAPQSVTQTINRVVERTIEKVVPVSGGQTAAVTIPKITNQEDQIVAAIGKNSLSLVRIWGYPAGASDVNPGDFFGFGIVIGSEGQIVGDLGLISANTQYRALMSDGTALKLELVDADQKNGLAIFKASSPETSSYAFTSASISKSDPKVGQTVIALGGKDKDMVSVGIVSSLNYSAGTDGNKNISSIDTTVNISPIYAGTILFGSSGDIVGIYRISSNGPQGGAFTPLHGVAEYLAASAKSAKTSN